MPNDPQVDLIYAILALDSYNRGYGAGIDGLVTSGSNALLGNWSIITTATDELDDPQSAGFYAIAYTNAATGEKVISYRGTDEPNPFAARNDAVNAYGIALGAARHRHQAIHRSC